MNSGDDSTIAADEASGTAQAAKLQHVQKVVSDPLGTIVVKVGVGNGMADDLDESLEVTTISQETETPGKTPLRRFQRYRKTWEGLPELKDWLEAVEGDPHTAWCRVCRCGLTCHLKNLTVHAKSTKHMKRKATRGLVPAPAPPAEALLRRPRGKRRGKTIVVDPCRASQQGASSPAEPAAFSLRLSTDSPEDSPEPVVFSLQPSPAKFERQLDVSYGDADRVNYSIGLHNQTVGFVGGGCIAQATLKGMMDKGIISPGNVIASAPSNRNLDAWRRWGCSTTRDNAEAVQESDLVLVAVKPQVAESVFRELGAALTDGRERCFVTLVTGWSRQRVIQAMTSGSQATPEGSEATPFHVVRCVPNLSVSIGEGSSVYCRGEGLPRRWLLAVETVFSALGACQQSDEYLMDVYSGAFSSGTAFVLSFIDALASGAVNLGVPWHEAIQMAAKTTSGAAQLVLDSGRSPSELRRDASAAGGGTLAGSMALQKAGLEYAVMSAVQAASERCGQLGDAKPRDRDDAE